MKRSEEEMPHNYNPGVGGAGVRGIETVFNEWYVSDSVRSTPFNQAKVCYIPN